VGHRLGHRHWWRSWLGYDSPSRLRRDLIRISGPAVNVTLAFCMGQDLEGIMNSSFGQPMAQIFFNSFGQKGTLAMWSFIIIAQYMMGSSMVRFSVPSWKRVAVGLTIISVACCVTPIFRLVGLKFPPPSDTHSDCCCRSVRVMVLSHSLAGFTA
jgi:hypothetical protein